jgi:hypothetical protein
MRIVVERLQCVKIGFPLLPNQTDLCEVGAFCGLISLGLRAKEIAAGCNRRNRMGLLRESAILPFGIKGGMSSG